MAENSAISWTDHTMNFWWGCTKVGPGCDHCYAESFDKRVGGDHWGPGVPRRLVKDWSKPRKWNREAERTGVRPWVFAQSMSDIFDNEVPAEWRDRAWDLVRETPHLRWIFVTKRIGNAAKMLPLEWREHEDLRRSWTFNPFSHCGLVATICNQEEADRDIPKLLATPAAWRGISAEPLLGPIDFAAIDRTGRYRIDALRGREIDDGCFHERRDEKMAKLDWIIVGGESGSRARPMHLQWARDIRDQCAAAGVSYHFKQNGEFIHGGEIQQYRVGKKEAGRLLDGMEHNGMPPGASL